MNYTVEAYSNINPALFYGGNAVVDYCGIDNNNYVAGEGFCCGDNNLKTKSIADDSPNYEKLQYYYHSDHLGSASYITNLDGEVVQHIEYVPFGEVFLEERNNTWNTPFLFNGKELDEETGLYYYGARYYNPRISLWYGVDPLAEKYPAHSPYCYTMNNPVMLVDPDGKQVRPGIRYGNINNYNKRPPSAGTIRYTHYNPASRPNRVNTSYFEPSVSNGGSTYTNPQMTRGNKRAQDMNAMVQGAHLLLDEINSITKIEQRTTRGSFTDYRFEFSTKDAEINFKQEQYEFESQYKQKISELDVPINPGSGATNVESKEYRDNLMIYGMKKILIQMDMGDSPKEKLIKAFEANKNEAFEIKSQRTQQKPIIYETPK